MSIRPELTTLGFVIDKSATKVLMVHRISRNEDEQLGKWNGLGGKVEPDEDIWHGMAREIKEEANIDVLSMKLRGTISWPGFHRDGSDVFGFIYLIDSWTGTPPQRNAEGPLVWHPISKLKDLNMWAGDRFFIPLVFDPSVTSFDLVIPYLAGQPQGCSGRIEQQNV